MNKLEKIVSEIQKETGLEKQELSKMAGYKHRSTFSKVLINQNMAVWRYHQMLERSGTKEILTYKKLKK